MALASKIWAATSPDDVVAEFLKGERHRFHDPFVVGPVYRPDLADEGQNILRRALLQRIRSPLVSRIPGDTAWFRVSSLASDDLDELRVIGRCGWDHGRQAGDLRHPPDENELKSVARRRPGRLVRPPGTWDCPILWGHDRRGPFTILEGNHRLVAYASSERPPPLDVNVIVGLSGSPCPWHLPDPL